MQTFRYMFPHLKWVPHDEYSIVDHTIKINSNIMYQQHDTVSYGRVTRISGDQKTITIRPYMFKSSHALLKCPKFESLREQPAIDISLNDYIGHFLITKGYVNTYVCLQLIKK
jgi:hypothetical protein